MSTRSTKEIFVEKARRMHGDVYDYSKVQYINNATKVEIVCPSHGSFWQLPPNHTNGNGCPNYECKSGRKKKTIVERRERQKTYNKPYYEKNKETLKAYGRNWRRNNKEKMYVGDIRRKYGITMDQLKQMWISQEGKCAICGEKFKNKKDMNVDHNHKTGKVRQLLCMNHNLLLGHCGEDIGILLKAIEYLNKWNTDSSNL